LTSLARLTKGNGRVFYVNPDHVVSLEEGTNGTVINFAQGNQIVVKESLNVVVAAIQGAVANKSNN